MRVPSPFLLVAELAVIADEARAVAPPQILLDHGMAALLDGEDEARVDLRAHIALLDRKLGKSGIMIELGQRRARRRKRLLLGEHKIAESGEELELECERAVSGLGDARLERGKLGRGEAHDIGERLAVDEGLGMRRLGQGRSIGRGDLDEIAEHVVVADLERLDGGRLGIGRLQAGDDLAAAVAQFPLLVEICARAVADETAVACIHGQALGQRSGKRLLDLAG